MQTVLQGAQRLLSQAVKKNGPMTPKLLSRLAERHGGPTASLKDLRFLFICLVGYAGLMRIDELAHLRKRHVIISDHGMEIHLPSAKTDQHRQGNTVVVARTSTITCPVSITERYMHAKGDSLAPDSHLLLRLVPTKDGLKACANKTIGYSRIREIFREHLAPLVPADEISRYGLHSLRSGGASAAAQAGVSDRLISKHGRWRSEKSRDGYIKDSTETRLTVSRSLGI